MTVALDAWAARVRACEMLTGHDVQVSGNSCSFTGCLIKVEREQVLDVTGEVRAAAGSNCCSTLGLLFECPVFYKCGARSVQRHQMLS